MEYQLDIGKLAILLGRELHFLERLSKTKQAKNCHLYWNNDFSKIIVQGTLDQFNQISKGLGANIGNLDVFLPPTTKKIDLSRAVNILKRVLYFRSLQVFFGIHLVNVEPSEMTPENTRQIEIRAVSPTYIEAFEKAITIIQDSSNDVAATDIILARYKKPCSIFIDRDSAMTGCQFKNFERNIVDVKVSVNFLTLHDYIVANRTYNSVAVYTKSDKLDRSFDIIGRLPRCVLNTNASDTKLLQDAIKKIRDANTFVYDSQIIVLVLGNNPAFGPGMINGNGVDVLFRDFLRLASCYGYLVEIFCWALPFQARFIECENYSNVTVRLLDSLKSIFTVTSVPENVKGEQQAKEEMIVGVASAIQHYLRQSDVKVLLGSELSEFYNLHPEYKLVLKQSKSKLSENKEALKMIRWVPDTTKPGKGYYQDVATVGFFCVLLLVMFLIYLYLLKFECFYHLDPHVCLHSDCSSGIFSVEMCKFF